MHRLLSIFVCPAVFFQVTGNTARNASFSLLPEAFLLIQAGHLPASYVPDSHSENLPDSDFQILPQKLVDIRKTLLHMPEPDSKRKKSVKWPPQCGTAVLRFRLLPAFWHTPRPRRAADPVPRSEVNVLWKIPGIIRLHQRRKIRILADPAGQLSYSVT